MNRDETWSDAKRLLPLGARVRGVVKKSYPFGMFVEVPDFPNVSVVVDAVSYTPHGKIVDSTEWPTIGSLVEGVVVDHVEHNREIKLRVE